MNIFFLDVESAGLRGEPFSAALLSQAGTVLFDGYYRHADLKTNNWLIENVEPNLTGTQYGSREFFLTAFANSYKEARAAENIAVVAHMGIPVESNLFQTLFKEGLIEEFDGPYPLLDTAPLIFAAGFDPTSEEYYAKEAGIFPANHNAHGAKADAELTRLVWNHLTKTSTAAPAKAREGR